MSETKEAQPSVNGEPHQVDLRAELSKKLYEEFTIALALQEGLTDAQRDSLSALITEPQISSTAILKVLRSTNNQ